MVSRIDILMEFESLLPNIQLPDGGRIDACRVPHLMFFFETFSEVWSEYNTAIVNNLLSLCRHTKGLMAWAQVLEKHAEEDGELLSGIIVDYVEPLLFRASDLPGAVRSQCHHMAGKLTYLYRSRDDTLDEVRNTSHDDGYWRRYRNKQHVPCEEYDRLVDKVGRLRDSEGADHLKTSHGRRHHDIATFVGMRRYAPMIERTSGVIAHGYRHDEVDLHEEIGIIDNQRTVAKEAYQALSDYADHLLELLENAPVSAEVMTIVEA